MSQLLWDRTWVISWALVLCPSIKERSALWLNLSSENQQMQEKMCEFFRPHFGDGTVLHGQ